MNNELRQRLDNVASNCALIRDRAMTTESIDMRAHVADLCQQVSELAAVVRKAQEAHDAATE